MPRFEIETPQGRFEVEAPDQETAIQALQGQAGKLAEPQKEAEPSYDGGWFRAATEGSHAGLMGGFDDEITAGMLAPVDAAIDWFKGDGFDIGRAYNRKQQALDAQKSARRQEHPVASIGGEIAGGLALGGGAGKAGLTLAGKSLPVVGKTGAAALEGAGYGALYGAGEADPGERLSGAAQGAAFGAATGGAMELAGRGVSKALNNRASKAVAPSTDELASASNALYQQAEKAGVTIKAPAMNKLEANVRMAAGRINRDLRPNTAGIVEDVAALKGKPITLQELDELRQVVGQSMKNAQPQDVRTLQRVKNVIDGFADNMKPSDISGDIKGFDLIKQAREIWSRKAKSQVLDEIMEKAKNQATGFENGLVIQMRSLANNPKRLKAFSKEEQDLIKSVVRRGSVHGILRALGMLSPNSTFGGLMTGGVGVGAGILPGAAIAGTGMAARSGAGALTRAKVDALRNAVATGQMPIPASQLPNHLRKLIPGGAIGVNSLADTILGS